MVQLLMVTENISEEKYLIKKVVHKTDYFSHLLKFKH